MSIKGKEIKIDGLRMLTGLHTTTRQLFVCSAIVLELNKRQLPKDVLSKLMISWSTKEELYNQVYLKGNGKLTENGKKTTALNHYLDFCQSFGLISRLNDFYSNSRISFIFLFFLNKVDRERSTLSTAEKLFYLVQLFYSDSDGIILLLSILKIGKLNQKELQKTFKSSLNDRLLLKLNHASQIVRAEIGEKYRILNYQWQNAESYSEHILIPRCEWLRSLDLIEFDKQGSSTLYSLTAQGELFYQSLPNINDNYLKDINEDWLSESLFTCIGKIYIENQLSYTFLSELDQREQLGNALKSAFEVVKSSSSFRLPLFDTLLFVCMYLFNNKIVLNYKEVLNYLKIPFLFDGKKYLIQESGRKNESYITTLIAE